MSNTVGTIIRILWLMMGLIGGWWLGTTLLYALLILTFDLPFSWDEAGIVFGLVIAGRLFYPRNVFAW